MSRMLISAAVLGFGLLATATGANADGRLCPSCGPAGITRYTRTIHPSLYLTRYHDRSVYDRVTRVRYVMNVTRIQPIVHVHDVTRIHHRTIFSIRDVYAYQTPQWAPVSYLPQGLAGSGGCSCGDE